MFTLKGSKEIEVANVSIKTNANITRAIDVGEYTLIAMLSLLPSRLESTLGVEGLERNIWAISNIDGTIAWRIEPISVLTGGAKIHAVPTPYTDLQLKNGRIVVRNWAGFACYVELSTGKIQRTLPSSRPYRILALDEIEIAGKVIKMPAEIVQIIEFSQNIVVMFSWDAEPERGLPDEFFDRNVWTFSLTDGQVIWKIQSPSDAGYEKGAVRPGRQPWTALNEVNGELKAFNWGGFLYTVNPANGHLIGSVYLK